MSPGSDAGPAIRALVPGEAGLILPLVEEALAVHARGRPDVFLPPDDPGALRAELERRLCDDATTALVAFHPDDRPAGYVLFRIERRDGAPWLRQRCLGLLDQLCVAPALRRRGIATALVAAAADRLRSAGASQMEVAYWSFNRPSAALMERLGFRPARIVAHRRC